jgi:hypothetical protein
LTGTVAQRAALSSTLTIDIGCMARYNRLPKHLVIIGGMMTLWGYAWSALSGARRYDDLAFRRFVRRYQHDCLRLGKAGAMRKYSEQQAAVPARRAPRRIWRCIYRRSSGHKLKFARFLVVHGAWR